MPLNEIFFEDAVTFARAETAEYLNGSGVIVSAAADEPALAWSTAGDLLGLVIEGESVQTLANTSDPHLVLTNLFGGTQTADNAAAPDSTTTAAKVTEDTSNGAHYIGQNAQFAVQSDEVVCWSFFLKPNGRTKFQVSLFEWGALSNFIRTTIDLTAGTATSSVGGAGSVLAAPAPEAYPSGWWRITLIGTPSVGGAGNCYPRIAVLNSSGVGNYVGDGASGFWHWGHNFRQDGFQRSFIATTTAPKTRGADLVAVNNLDATFGATQGMFRARFLIPAAAPAGANRTILHLDDGTADNSYDLRVDAGGLNVTLEVKAGGSQVALITAGAALAGSNNIVAFSYITDGFRISLNGAAAVSDVSGAVPTGLSRMFLGASDELGSDPLDGVLRRVQRRRLAVSAVDLATLSASWT